MAAEQETLGTEIASARGARGLSVEDVARATRLRADLVRALEAGNLQALGAPVYGRGHLRSVAGVLGVDPAPWLNAYEQQVGAATPSTPVVPLGSDRAATRRANSMGVPGWVQAAAGAVLFLLVLGLVGLVSGEEDAPDELAIAPSASPPVVVPPASAAPPADPGAPAPDAVAQVPTQVSLQVRVTGGRSWLRVSRPDNTVLFEGTLDEGAVRDFADPQRLRLLVGDAGAVSLSVNGQDLGVVGAPGEVARLEYTPQDPAGA